MEPVDPRMGGLLGGGEPADPSRAPEDLRAIVAKAGRRMRVRAGALAGAVAMVAGGGVGYAVSTTGGSSPQVVATSQGAGGRPSSQAPGAAQAAGPSASMALPGATKFSRLFTRQANGVDIRAFLVAFPTMAPLGATGVAAPPCTTTRLQAELSTPAMVAVAGGGGFVSQQSGAALISVEPAVVGEAEGDPVAVVVVQTGPTVAKVRMSFSGGSTDEMAPREGWSVLAAPAPSFQPGKASATAIGTLTALGSTGGTLATQSVTWPPGPVPAPGGETGSAGSTGSGSGAVGTGSAGSGTASSGTAVSGPASAPVVTAAPAVANPCQVPPPCAGYPNGIPCPTPAPMPVVTPQSKTPTNSATTPATGSGG